MSDGKQKDSFLRAMVDVASEAYGDGLVQEAFDSGESPGDTLALFISRELGDACSCQNSLADCLREGIRLMEAARDELDAVAEALDTRLEEAERNDE